MRFPLSYWDFAIWLAANSVILLSVSEVLSSYLGKSFRIEKRNLRMVAVIVGFLFVIIVIIEAYRWPGPR